MSSVTRESQMKCAAQKCISLLVALFNYTDMMVAAERTLNAGFKMANL